MRRNMEILLLCIGAAGLAAGAAAWRFCQRKKNRMTELNQQMEHFLLYGENPLSETLDEGTFANLNNQIARLERQLLYQRSQSGQREEEMARFVENMAHQMKNSVTALQIQLDLLAARLPREEGHSIEKSQACLERLTGEIDRILKSGQLAAGKIAMEFQPMELSAEAAACMERLRPLAESKGAALVLEGRANISADGFWLAQAMENLLKNAIEHTAEGTEITLRIADEGSRVAIRIEDEGRGIPPGELPALFTRFHRCGASKAGYGIGLSMAKDIVEAHHGSLTAGNREKVGAWFEIQLPRIDGAQTYSPCQTADLPPFLTKL